MKTCYRNHLTFYMLLGSAKVYIHCMDQVGNVRYETPGFLSLIFRNIFKTTYEGVTSDKDLQGGCKAFCGSTKTNHLCDTCTLISSPLLQFFKTSYS